MINSTDHIDTSALRTPDEVAADLGTTARALVRFARRYEIPIVEVKRGVYRFTPKAVNLIIEAAERRFLAKFRSTTGPLKVPAARGRKQGSAYDEAMAAMTSMLQKKPLRSRRT